MSQYSGKFDLYDIIELHGLDNILRSDIYLGNNIIPLRIESEHDLVPFYGYSSYMSAYSAEEGKGSFYLNDKSNVDIREDDMLLQTQKSLISYFKQCKYKHIVPNLEKRGYLKLVDKDAEDKIFERLQNDNMSLLGISTQYGTFYRQKLYEAMIGAGWGDIRAKRWCFPYSKYQERFWV